MKILFIIHNVSYCGAERVLALVANQLINRGYDVYILTNPDEISFPLDSKIHILDAYLYSKSYNTTHTFGKVIRTIKYNLGFSRTLKKYINDIKPNHIVSFLGFCIWQLLPYRRKYKITISDHSAMNRSVGLIRDFERRVLPELFYQHTVLTNADKVYLGTKRTNVIVMNNPLSYSPISIDEYNKLFDLRKNLLFCGSIDRYKIKGLDNLLRALAIVQKTNPNFVLDIAGKGSDKNISDLQQLAFNLNVHEKINFMGYIDDVSELMKNHSMLLVPSRSEGFGMVIIEAMACGCPVISYALSGPCEIIDSGKDGILVKNQDIEQLSNAISLLIKDTGLRRTLGENAISSVTRFSLQSIVDRWETILQ